MIDENPYPRPDKDSVTSTLGLLYFVWEREAIRLARENEHPAPWTADPVLAKYKFTNIHRRHDRVSQWIIREVIEPNLKDHNLWFTLLITRLINWPPTLEALLREGAIPCHPEDFDPSLFSRVIEDYLARWGKAYSGAYMVYPTKKDPGGKKSQALALHIIYPAAQMHEEICDSIESEYLVNFVTALSKSFGISAFMAGQVAADLTYAEGHFDQAADLYSYAPIGPGSSRGLNYLRGRKPFATWTQRDFNENLIALNHQIAKHLEITDLTLHDVQNVMCEYSKYCRTVLGEGVPKTLYKPETEF